MHVKKGEAEEAAVRPGSPQKETIRENKHQGWVSVGLRLRVMGWFRNERTPVHLAKSGSQNSETLACILGSRKPCGLNLKQSTLHAFIPRPQ